jgi:hypothetical protein
MIKLVIALSILPLLTLVLLIIDMICDMRNITSPLKGMYTWITLLNVTAMVIMAYLVLTF